MSTSLFQSTPPDGGRPGGIPHGIRESRVSIHAPGRGATEIVESRNTSRSRFNPRPRTGGDPATPAKPFVSIPFQSTPPDGGRPRIGDRFDTDRAFQSTPPDG